MGLTGDTCLSITHISMDNSLNYKKTSKNNTSSLLSFTQQLSH